MVTINELMRDQVTLEIECLDRLYLNGYVPTLQTSGQVVTFLTQHRGQAIPSPVLLQQMSETFVRAVHALAATRHIPLIRFEHGVRKDDVAAEQRAHFTATEEVVFI